MDHLTNEKPKIREVTAAEQHAIDEFLRFGMKACERAYQQIRVVDGGAYQPQIDGQVKYWKNGRSVLKWLLNINRQREPIENEIEKPDLRKARREAVDKAKRLYGGGFTVDPSS